MFVILPAKIIVKAESNNDRLDSCENNVQVSSLFFDDYHACYYIRCIFLRQVPGSPVAISGAVIG